MDFHEKIFVVQLKKIWPIGPSSDVLECPNWSLENMFQFAKVAPGDSLSLNREFLCTHGSKFNVFLTGSTSIS